MFSRVDEELMHEWMIWVVVSRGMATLRELETTWTLDDVIRAVDFMTIQRDIERIVSRGV